MCALLLSLWFVLTESSGIPFCVGRCCCFRRYTKNPTTALITVNEPTTPPTIAPRLVDDSLLLNGVFVPYVDPEGEMGLDADDESDEGADVDEGATPAPAVVGILGDTRPL